MMILHGQISVKEDKYKKEVMLLSINRKHSDYSSFKPEKRQVEKNDQVSDHTAANESRSSKTLEAAEIYKPSVPPPLQQTCSSKLLILFFWQTLDSVEVTEG